MDDPPDAKFLATSEPLDDDGDLHLVRIHLRAEAELDEKSDRRPRYFAVCNLKRDSRDSAAVEVKGFVVRGETGLPDMAGIVRAVEREMARLGIARYWFERAGGKTRQVVRTVPGGVI